MPSAECSQGPKKVRAKKVRTPAAKKPDATMSSCADSEKKKGPCPPSVLGCDKCASAKYVIVKRGRDE